MMPVLASAPTRTLAAELASALTPALGLATVAAFLASLGGTLLFRRVLLARAMLDTPNERSSHQAPVARGGGAVFVALALVWLAMFALSGAGEPRVMGTGAGAAGQHSAALPGMLAAALGCLAVAVVGWVDDACGVRPAIRLTVHLSASALAVYATLSAADATASTAVGWLAIATLTVACAWMVNLVNFMDGIDGIAASYGVFVLAGTVVLAALHHHDTAAPLLPVAAVIAGFLVVNISRLKVFMGDVGSGTLGLLLAWALLASVVAGAINPWAAVILPATFVADASVTLAVRLARRQHPARAHRTHAYQRAQRRGASHLAVTGVYCAVNVLLVLPAAMLATARPEWGAACALGTYAMLSAAAFLAGAGREP